MDIQIIQVPYDSGHFDLRMGLGPAHLLQHGLAKQLQDAGHQISETRLHCAADPMNPVATTFSINHLLAKHVRLALQNHSLPLVLAGNCNSCIGSIAGAGKERLGVIWFDAHADFNTPDTTLSGYIDGMGLAMATGRGWKNLMAEIPGFKPVLDKHVILVGARDLDPEEDQGLAASDIAVVTPQVIQQNGLSQAMTPLLTQLKQQVERIYLHIDMDILDPAIYPSKVFAPPGGLVTEDVVAAIELIKAHFTIRACALTAYDPASDPENRALKAGLQFAQTIASSQGPEPV